MSELEQPISSILLIKRYPNRKLYNTRSKEYITLEQLVVIVRQGIEIQVIDNVNNEDLTAMVLSQILFMQEKRQGGLLPIPLLAALVHAGGDAFEGMRRFFTASFNLTHFVNDEISQRIRILTSRSQITAQEGQLWLDSLVAAGDDSTPAPFSFDRLLNSSLETQGFALRADYERLLYQVEELTVQVDRLTQVSRK